MSSTVYVEVNWDNNQLGILPSYDELLRATTGLYHFYHDTVTEEV